MPNCIDEPAARSSWVDRQRRRITLHHLNACLSTCPAQPISSKEARDWDETAGPTEITLHVPPARLLCLSAAKGLLHQLEALRPEEPCNRVTALGRWRENSFSSPGKSWGGGTGIDSRDAQGRPQEAHLRALLVH